MKDRIAQFLANEGISPAEFADKIGVQRSSVSHVLNGRNYPSASFIQKMLASYKTLNSRWLLLGEGPIFEAESTPVKEPLLFQFPNGHDAPKTAQERIKSDDNPLKDVSKQPLDNLAGKHSSAVHSDQQVELNLSRSMSNFNGYLYDNKEVDRIVFFFKDKTFAVYTPSK